MLAVRPHDVPAFPGFSHSTILPVVPVTHPLSHLSPTDQSLFYSYGIGQSRPVPFPIVHHSFEHHARLQPHVTAVEHNNDSISYAQLDLRANRLAKRLRDAGIRPGCRVCIVARRSISLIIAILGVLKAGGQYVPLDAVTITDETLRFVLQDASPSAVLVMNEYSHRIDTATCPILLLEDLIQADEHAAGLKIDEAGLTSADGCYCIYTSGTTGRPKGVDVRHQGVSNGAHNHLLFAKHLTNNKPSLSDLLSSWKRQHESPNPRRPTAQYRLRHGCLGNSRLVVQRLHPLPPR